MTPAPDPADSPAAAWRTLTKWFLLCVLLVLGVVGYYVVENVRAKAAWEDYRKQVGLPDEAPAWETLLPKAVPAESNFYGTPVLQAAGIKGREDSFLVSQLKSVPAGAYVGEVFNEKPAQIGAFVAELRRRGMAGSNTVETAAALEGFHTVEREFEELREASLRPYAVFPSEGKSPIAGPAPNYVTLRAISQSLSLRASVYLAQKQPGEAWRDLLVIFRIGDSLDHQGTLVAAMIRVAISGLALGPVREGLAGDGWSARELQGLQEKLQSINLVGSLDHALRMEQRWIVYDATLDFLKAGDRSAAGPQAEEGPVRQLSVGLRPTGWIYRGLIAYDIAMREHLAAIHTAETRIDLAQFELATARAKDNSRKRGAGMFLGIFPNLAKAADTTARVQNQVNLGIIACALQRYRLIHGAYPVQLTELEAGVIARLPREVVTGKSYDYQRLADGSFELRSSFLVSKGTDSRIGATLRWIGKP